MPAPPRAVDLGPALAHLRAVDPRLAPWLDRHGAPALAPTRDPYRTLVSAIVHQQLSGAAAATILGRLRRAVGGGRLPRPAALAAAPVSSLRAAGLSAAKAEAVQDLAARFADRRLRAAALAAATDDEVREALLPVRGVGPWTVDMFLLFGLARLDVLPVGDLGVRKGMRRHFRLRALPGPARMEALAAPWRPFRSVASWTMWRVAEAG